MHKNEYEIIILQPTSLFRLFLTVLRPDIDWPSLSAFQKDTTAYSLKKCHSDDGLISQMEEHFLDMLRHEVSKWVGEEVSEAIKISFFDFLRFFKFELHSDVIVMESSFKAGQQMLCIKPRTALFKRNLETKPALKPIRYDHSTLRTTVIIKNFKAKKEIKPFVQQFYRPIFTAEMRRVCSDKTQWPEVKTVEAFNRYFECDTHSRLIHLQ